MREDLIERTLADVIETIEEGEFYTGYDQSVADLAILRAALAPVEAVPVVKPLEWVKHPSADAWRADTMLGTYQVWVGSKATAWQFDGLLGDCVNDPTHDEVSGKASAQKHFDAAILSALAHPPAQAGAVTEASRVKVPDGQTPLDNNLRHRLLDVFAEGEKARETGATSPYHGHSLEHCLHASGWVLRDLLLALKETKAALTAAHQRIEKLEAGLRPLVEAAYGLSFGHDWNNGNHAKKHGYRQKLLDALPRALALLSKQGDEGNG